jgi:hypothetical protein
MLDDIAQWELLFRGEEVFWKSAGALREDGYTSVLNLTQDTVNCTGSVPMLTREPESRGTKHIQMFIPKGIKGITATKKMIVQLSKHG